MSNGNGDSKTNIQKALEAKRRYKEEEKELLQAADTIGKANDILDSALIKAVKVMVRLMKSRNPNVKYRAARSILNKRIPDLALNPEKGKAGNSTYIAIVDKSGRVRMAKKDKDKEGVRDAVREDIDPASDVE